MRKIITLFIFILFLPVIITALEPQIYSEYKDICDEWDNCFKNGYHNGLKDIIKAFKAFEIKNKDNVFSAISSFNIGQIYEFDFGDNVSATEYYLKCLNQIRENREKWKTIDSDEDIPAREYGANSVYRMVMINFEEGDTTETLNYIDTLIKEFPDSSSIAAIPLPFYHLSYAKFIHGNNPELIEKFPFFCSYIMERYNGEHKKIVYESVLNAYYQMVDNNLAKVKDYQEIYDNYTKIFKDEITPEKKNKFESRLNELRQSKIDKLIKFDDINQIPRQRKMNDSK